MRVRSGPDWAALVSDWMTEYERTLDPECLQKTEAGISDLRKMPLGLTSGPVFGFDPQTGHLQYEGEAQQGSMHLQACMGETEVWLETAEMLRNKDLAEMTAQNGQYFFLSPEERTEISHGLLLTRQFGSPIYSAEMQAWAAMKENNKEMAGSIWRNLLSLLYSRERQEGFQPVSYGIREDGSLLLEIPWISTNFTAQWCLKVIVTSDFIPECKPETFEELEKQLQEQPPQYGLYGA